MKRNNTVAEFARVLGIFALTVFFTSASVSAAEVSADESSASDIPDNSENAEEGNIKKDTSKTYEQEKAAEIVGGSMNNNDLESKYQSMDTDAPEQPAFPGIVNRLVRHTDADRPSVYFYYPETGQKKIDDVLKLFAEDAITAFENDLKDHDGKMDNLELIGTYSVSRPNPNVISIIYSIYDYVGGAHGNLTLVSLNYDLNTGERLKFEDLFRDPEKALAIMSELSVQKLTETLKEDADEEMIGEGTRPETDNFDVLNLTPGGLTVEFQPYQVGPWSIGVQEVPVSLSQLAPAGPSPLVWPQESPDGK